MNVKKTIKKKKINNIYIYVYILYYYINKQITINLKILKKIKTYILIVNIFNKMISNIIFSILRITDNIRTIMSIKKIEIIISF